jgi:hypothetical protein
MDPPGPWTHHLQDWVPTPLLYANGTLATLEHFRWSMGGKMSGPGSRDTEVLLLHFFIVIGDCVLLHYSPKDVTVTVNRILNY